MIPLCNQINTANGNASAVDIRPRCKSPSRVPLIEFEGDNDDESQRSDRDTPSPTHTFSKQHQGGHSRRLGSELHCDSAHSELLIMQKQNAKVTCNTPMKGNTRSSSVPEVRSAKSRDSWNPRCVKFE